MVENELGIPIKGEFNCNRCPNRYKIDRYEYPYTDLPVCPKNQLLAEAGPTPTERQLIEGAEKYGLIFTDQMEYYDDFGTRTPVTIFQCPNGEGSIPGIIVAETQIKPK